MLGRTCAAVGTCNEDVIAAYWYAARGGSGADPLAHSVERIILLEHDIDDMIGSFVDTRRDHGSHRAGGRRAIQTASALPVHTGLGSWEGDRKSNALRPSLGAAASRVRTSRIAPTGRRNSAAPICRSATGYRHRLSRPPGSV